jgi:hypothetical protein
VRWYTPDQSACLLLLLLLVLVLYTLLLLLVLVMYPLLLLLLLVQLLAYVDLVPKLLHLHHPALPCIPVVKLCP